MLNVYNVSVLDLIPQNLKQDPDVIAAAKAIDTEFTLVANEVKQCILLPRLNELSNDVLNLLAWQMHIDFWDTTLSIEIKRELIKNSARWHKNKGTPGAVEELISTVFDYGQVVEWFDNGGAPYTFQVQTTNEAVTIDKAEQFARALNSVKNERSQLDKIILLLSEDMQIYFGGVVHTGDFITIQEVV